jgi:hypothetical protein
MNGGVRIVHLAETLGGVESGKWVERRIVVSRYAHGGCTLLK